MTRHETQASNRAGDVGDDMHPSRREVLKRGAMFAGVLAGGPTLLAACGSSGQTGASVGASVGGTLKFLSFEGYDLPDVMKEWRQRTGVHVAASYVSGPDDVVAKLKSDPNGGIDLVTFDSPRKPLLEELGLIRPIDTASVPNLAGLLPYFRDDPDSWWHNSKGQRDGVAWSWSILGICYNTTLTSAPLSYHELLSPKFKGKLVIEDNANDVYATAGIALGIDMTKITRADLARLQDFLRAMIRQSHGVGLSWGDIATQLASGQAAVSYPGAAFVVGLTSGASSPAVKFTIPQEGGITFADAWAIPTQSRNPAAALSWINETLVPAIDAAACDVNVYAPTVKAAVPLVAAGVTNQYPAQSEFDTYIKKSPFYRMPPQTSTQYVTFRELIDSWEGVKASA